jgi:Asp/Glu/hydantoin racemase
VKVLWQSFLDPDDHRPYLDALRVELARATPDVDYDVVGIRPPDRHLHALTEVRCGIAALRNALYADAAGYDAVVMGHFQEPFLHEIRASVGLPVVGLCEASLAVARGRIGLVTIDEVFVVWHEEQVRRLGFGHRVVGVRAIGVAPDGFMDAMTPGPARDRLRVEVEAAAAALVAAGAEVVVPAGALPAVALPDATVCGIPFLNCVAAAARAVTTTERAKTFDPPPPAALEEFLAATGGPLTDPVR